MSGEDNKPLRSAPPSGLTDPFHRSIKAITRGIIGRYSDYTKDITAPDLFKLWTAISAIGSSGERRVYTRMRQGITYANQYLLLVGEAGTGKSVAMSPMQALVLKALSFIFAANDVSKQGFLDQLAGDEGHRFNGLDEFHYLGLWVSEITNFMPVFDPALAGVLTDLWDCPAYNQEVKRHMRKGRGQVINFPACSLLMGCATGSLGNVFTSDTWKTGFMARMVIIYSDEKTKPTSVDDIWGESSMDDVLADEIVQRLKQLGGLNGRMLWTPDAMDSYFQFKAVPTQPPDHERLKQYNIRRDRHVIKLAMCMALNEGRMQITDEDFLDAVGIMNITEKHMADVFYNMTTHADYDKLLELANQVRLACLAKRKRGEDEPYVSKAEMIRLMSKVFPHNHLNTAFKMAEEGAFIKRVAGTQGETVLYAPGDKFDA